MKCLILSILVLMAMTSISCVSKKGVIKTYNNPSVDASKIHSVSIFPLRNSFVQSSVGLGTGEMLELNKMFQVEFANRNPNTTLVNSVSSRELLNQYKLVNSYDTLLSVFENTGLPNTNILNTIGDKLKVDAIIQGFLKEVFQRDGAYGVNRGETRITIKYVMLSTISGDVLWEATCSGYKGTGTTLAKAPPIDDVIEIIEGKIVSAMPTLSTF